MGAGFPLVRLQRVLVLVGQLHESSPSVQLEELLHGTVAVALNGEDDFSVVLLGEDDIGVPHYLAATIICVFSLVRRTASLGQADTGFSLKSTSLH